VVSLSTTTKVPRRGVGTYVLGAHVVLPCQADPRASLRSFAAYRTRTPAVLATLSSGGTPQLTRPPKNADPFEPRRVCPASSLLKRTPYTYCYSSIKCNCCSCHHHAKACAEGFGPNPSAQAARMNNNYFEVSLSGACIAFKYYALGTPHSNTVPLH
jgi:hypothetical protein